MPKIKYFSGLGRRKTATATVRLIKGKAETKINDMPLSQYFYDNLKAEKIIYEPLEICGLLGKYYFSSHTSGGGKKVQVEAIRLAISRAIVKLDDKFKLTLQKNKFLTRDSREKERKKPGLKRARRAPQWQKR